MPLNDPSSDAPSLDQPAGLTFETDRSPWQRSLRWTKPERDRRILWLGVLLAILVTVMEIIGFGIGMRTAPVHRSLPTTVDVRLIDAEPDVPPPPPEPEPPQFVARPSRIVIAPPKVRTLPPPKVPTEDSDAMSARIGNAGAAALPTPQLFNPDGSIRLGADIPIAPATAPVNPREAARKRWVDIEKRGENPLDCKKTRFAGAYALDESVGSGVARKYLSWAGLYDPHDTEKRAARAAEGCDPAR